ncbi:MAG: response regulator [Candidatus Thorarchaeota archaeon]
MVKRVLLVDDDIELLDIARMLLNQKEPDLEIVVSSSVKDALEKLENEDFDVIIADYMMPDSSGLDMLEALRAGGDDIGFIIWTGYSDEEVAIKSLNLGADYYILKGDNYKDQFSVIREIIQKVTRTKPKNGSSVITQETASNFIHKLSHDITGIAHNIMGYATLLEDDCNPEYVKGIGRLLTKLNDKVKTAVSEIDAGDLNR